MNRVFHKKEKLRYNQATSFDHDLPPSYDYQPDKTLDMKFALRDLVFVDTALLDQWSGKISLIGIFNRFNLHKEMGYVRDANNFSIYGILTREAENGELPKKSLRVEIRVLDSDKVAIITEFIEEFIFSKDRDYARFIITTSPATFKEGKYSFEIFVDGVSIGTRENVVNAVKVD